MITTCSLCWPERIGRGGNPTSERSRSTGSTSERSTITSRPCSVRNAARLSSTVSLTCVSGMAYTSPSARASSARTIARVSGRRSVTVVPCPCEDRMSTAPPSERTRVYTASIPTPRPDISVTFSAVEKPGRPTIRTSSSSFRLGLF